VTWLKKFPNTVSSKYFADDAKLYTEIRSGDDIDNLQSSLDLFTEWAETWQLSISIKKCFTMDLASGTKAGSFCENTISGTEIPNLTGAKDLGVYLDTRLSFSTHISQIVAKAKQRIFLLFRTFVTKEPKLLLQDYKSYILLILDYCSPVWAPTSVGDIKHIESVQRCFTRKIPGLKFMSYSERMRSLGIHSLELRRLHTDLVLCYKILNGLVAGPPSVYGIVLSDRKSRGHSRKILAQHYRVNVRKSYFCNRICEPWNSLTEEVVNASSANVFKKLLLTCNLGKFLLLDL